MGFLKIILMGVGGIALVIFIIRAVIRKDGEDGFGTRLLRTIGCLK